MGNSPESQSEPKKELKEQQERASENQEKQILTALKTLSSIWEENYGDRHSHEEVPLETKDYRFIITNYGSDGGPSIEIYIKNPKKGEITRMTFQGLDPNAVDIWIDHRPETDQQMKGAIGQEIIGGVKSAETGIDVENIPVVLQNLLKFATILSQANTARKLKKLKDEQETR